MAEAAIPEVEFRFTPHELEVLRQFETARSLQDMMMTPGWKKYRDIVEARISLIKEQFLRAKNLDKDALWAMQIRLNGIIDFMEVLFDGLDSAIECLEPEAMRRIIQMENRQDLTGEVGLQDI